MGKLLLFGGTAEGRALAEYCQARSIPALVCVATEYGEQLLEPSGSLRVHTGRLDSAAMTALISAEQPTLVADATHPYATIVSRQLCDACASCGVRYLRLSRESLSMEGCLVFADLATLVQWLATTEGVVFSTLGAKEAAALAAVPDYQQRIRLRVLPLIESLRLCLDAGFPAKHILCMQGPFSAALNEAMFRETGASILITKETGSSGGFAEKVSAARACGMTVAVIRRPEESGQTCSMEQMQQFIEEIRP